MFCPPPPTVLFWPPAVFCEPPATVELPPLALLIWPPPTVAVFPLALFWAPPGLTDAAWWREVVHPDAVLIPLAVGLVPAAAGALFLLASRAMRRGTAGRWTAQWGALLVPLTLSAFVWLSLQ